MSCEYHYTYKELWYDKYHFNDSTVNNCVKFEGQLLCPLTSNVIPNAEIQLKREYGRGVIGTVTSDENGIFRFHFLPDTIDKEWFRVNIVKEEYLDAELYFGINTDNDSIYNSTVYLLPSTKLNIQIKNINPHNKEDKITIAFGYGQKVYLDFIEQNPYRPYHTFDYMTLPGEEVIGKKINTISTYYFPYKETIHIYWTVVKGGISEKFWDEVVLDSRNIEYLIEY